MNLLITIGIILGAIIVMSIVIYIFEKSTMEAMHALDVEYDNMYRYYHDGSKRK